MKSMNKMGIITDHTINAPPHLMGKLEPFGKRRPKSPQLHE